MKQRKFRKKKYLEDVISIKWIFVGVIFYFYGAMLKKEIVKSAYEAGLSFNNWDIILRLLNDMYLIVYFIIPLVLFFSIRSILVDFNYQILIRLSSFKKWVYHSLKHFWIQVTPLLFLWVFISLFMMIGFPYSWDWSKLSGSNNNTNILYGLVTVFGSPITALIAQLVLVILTLSLLHIALSIVYVLNKNKHLILLISIVIFFGGIAGFKLLPNNLGYLSLCSYLSIAKAVESFNSPILVYLVVLLFGILSFLFLQILDLNKKVFISLITPYLPTVIYLFLCVIGICSTANSLKSTDATILDVWIMSFRGSNAENFAYLPFFFYLIVFFGFIYLVQLFLSNEIEQLGYYKIIRFKNLNKWFWSWMKRLLIVIVLFLFGMMGLSFIIAVCFGGNVSFNLTTLSTPLYEVFYHFFINGFLQIVFYIFAVFIVSWISKETVHSVILISVFMIIMLPGINIAGIIPVGLNSFVYLSNYSPFYITKILIVINVITWGFINFLLKRSLKI